VPENADPNRGSVLGVSACQSAIRYGRRSSAARGYLAPVRRRPNLHVITGATATRVLFEGRRAAAVNFRAKDGSHSVAKAAGEIILCAGAYHSPHLLMLSGVGPAEHLREHGLEVLADLPVGQNLLEHPGVAQVFARRDFGTLHRQLRLDRIALSMIAAYFFGVGFAATVPGGTLAFAKSTEDLSVPDLEFLMLTAPAGARPWFPGLRKPYEDEFAIMSGLMHAHSRGEVLLASPEPLDPPRIRLNLLTDRRDLIGMRTAVKFARDVAWGADLDAFRRRPLSPPCKLVADDEIDAFVRSAVRTFEHPAGTCAMGVDDRTVLDPELRVRGFERLRVVDASAMPTLIAGHTNACVMMMAEKAADLIRGRTAPIAMA